jgi:uncharacterized membrane protein YgcG
MLVEEHIRVRAEGQKIRRGIYRDFPTKYRDRHNNNYQVMFELVDVKRNGSSEPYHTKPLSNGIRVYIGSKDHFIKHGEHAYSIIYKTNRQLGFFEKFDELYWNVTGNGWDFPIDKATAIVNLPAIFSPDQIQLEAYTGPQGSKGSNYTATVEYDGSAWFETTRILGQGEGLTVVVNWPKGYVTEPSDEQQMRWFLRDNSSTVIGAGGLALLLAYYLVVWFRVGRDPEQGAIIPLYEPDPGYSPASMSFITNMGYEKKAFSAAIVNMAVKGYLEIVESSKNSFTLRKTGNKDIKLAMGEGAIASALFGGGETEITLKKTNHAKISKALKVHKRSLKGDYEKNYFVTNRGYLTPGIILSIITLAAVVLLLPDAEQITTATFMSIWLSIWSIGVFVLVAAVITAWKSESKASAIFITLFSIPFIGGEIGGLAVLITQISIIYALTLISTVAINILFYQWLKAPTRAGRKLLDRIEGFKLFLSVAEKDELNFKHPPEKTPELFEQYLPYAIALGVEQQWGERFSDVLSSAMTGNDRYHPAWYHGNSWNHGNVGTFTNTMGSAMSSAVSSSSTAPGSSSGSSGGGFSGGGGGGGGGGGW